MNKILVYGRNDCGKIGETTDMLVDGQYLQIGDVVEVTGRHGYETTNFVTKLDGHEKPIIYGWGASKIEDFKRIKILKKYHEVADGEEHCFVRMVFEKQEEKSEIIIKEVGLSYGLSCDLCENDKDFEMIFVNDDCNFCFECLADLGKKIIDALK